MNKFLGGHFLFFGVFLGGLVLKEATISEPTMIQLLFVTVGSIFFGLGCYVLNKQS